MNHLIRRMLIVASATLLMIGCTTTRTARIGHDEPPQAGKFGVLVMAHGGGETWNREVDAALMPLRTRYPLEIAFGMADAGTIQDGVSRLEMQGVERIGVVRLFISGESWYERTAQILGIQPGAPQRAPADAHAMHATHGDHSMAFWKIESTADFAMSEEGLMDAPEMGEVLLTRARNLSHDPRRESVLIIAHGPGDDAENRRWLQRIDQRAERMRQALPFRQVRVETLREDWPEKRQAAEARIRDYVTRANSDGGRAIVIPFRVQGFGPYAKVLTGLDYVADRAGLVPDPEVGAWVDRQAAALNRTFR